MRCLVVVLLSSVLGACAASGAGSGETKVVTSVYPIEFLVSEIAGGDVEVVNVTPPGVEPHDVELGSDQVIDVVEADLVVYLGSDFQPALEEALGDAEGETLDALSLAGPDAEATDAHFWLDPARLAAVAEELGERLAELDAEHADEYTRRADDLVADLRSLDARFEEGLSECKSDRIVTSHEAFAYLADRYGLQQIGIAGIDPEAEPSAVRLAEVAEFVRANDVSTIFFETLLPRDAAETIAGETGAQTDVLDPLESAPSDGDYISAMETNLENLRKALRCR